MGSLDFKILTEDLDAQLQRSVCDLVRAFFVRDPTTAADPSKREDLFCDIARSVAAGFLSAVRARVVDSIPEELWCRIWMHLDLAERIAVTHVCHGWRAYALHSHILWSEIPFYVRGRAEVDQYPKECYRSDREREDSGTEAEFDVHPSVQTNIDMVVNLLPRSGNNHLTLSLEITTRHCRSLIRRLAMELQAHHRRFDALHFEVTDHSVVSLFFAHFKAFPALRFITTRSLLPLADLLPTRYQARLFSFLYFPLSLPLMQQLKLNAELIWWRDRPCRFASLTSLQATVTCTSDVTAMLQACPALWELDLRIAECETSDWLVPEGTIAPYTEDNSLHISFDATRTAADRLQCVCLYDLTRGSEGVLLDIFGNRHRQTLSLDYHGTTACHESQKGGFSIFADIAHCTQLLVTKTARPTAVVISAEDATGRIRELALYHLHRISPAWANLSLDSLVDLTVDVHLWDQILQHLPPVPSLQTATILVVAVPPAAFRQRLWTPEGKHYVPCLQTLRLVAEPRRQREYPLVFPLDALIKILLPLQLERPMRLQLNPLIMLDGDVDLLSDKIHDVAVCDSMQTAVVIGQYDL